MSEEEALCLSCIHALRFTKAHNIVDPNSGERVSRDESFEMFCGVSMSSLPNVKYHRVVKCNFYEKELGGLDKK